MAVCLTITPTKFGKDWNETNLEQMPIKLLSHPRLFHSKISIVFKVCIICTVFLYFKCKTQRETLVERKGAKKNERTFIAVKFESYALKNVINIFNSH